MIKPISAESAKTSPDWAALSLVGESETFRAMLFLLGRCALVDATVLLCGETGTGKELAARALHYLGPRHRGPFVPVNCGALPDSLVEAELFGHARGAFTDAKTETRGVIGLAHGGTLFLDEVDSLSPRAQASLLRFVQDRTYRPLGARNLEAADVRIVAATNANLKELSCAGKFREDLLYRLNLLTVQLPALRERGDDALLLAETFMGRLVRQYRTTSRVLSQASVTALRKPRLWPGNVRELEHLVHRAFLIQQTEEVDLDLDPQTELIGVTAVHETPILPFAEAKAQALREFELRYLGEIVKLAKGNLSLAARMAGRERSGFCKLVHRYGLHNATLSARPTEHH